VRRGASSAPAQQADIERLIGELANAQARAFVARVEKVAVLPDGTDLVAVSTGDQSRGLRLTGDGTGIPVRIDDQNEHSVPLAEVLSTDVPFASPEAEVAAQVRTWKHEDPKHRVGKSTLARWFRLRTNIDWDDESLEFAFLS